jgi:seryl-tRNA synthetase
MNHTVTVELKSPATEMAQEEIPKQIAFLCKDIANIRFAREGAALEFEAPEERAEELARAAAEIAQSMQRSLRKLTRKLVYRSPAMDRDAFRGTGMTEGIRGMGRGQVALEGLPLRLYRYFDRTLEAIGAPFSPSPMLTPTLIPATTLAKCDYFRSFPHIVTFTCHLPEDMPRIDAFRARHQDRDTVDDQALADMATPEACLSPAVCYHVYAANRGRVLPAEGARYAIAGRCFRYESSKMVDLRRLWEFTMREIVFLGRREDVLALRDQGNEIVGRYLADHEIAGEIRTASDPFFIAPDAAAKTYFQISSETKFEISLLLPQGERLAAGSLNYHTDFFGRAFDCAVEGAGPMHSVCIAFGLERWVYAFLAQHGDDPLKWPDPVRRAPELSGI